MFRNAFYNGDFRIAQRGTSFTNPNATYTLDRWWIEGYGAVGNGTVSQIQSGLQNFSNAFQLATTSTSSGNWMISQSLETRDVVRFQGQPVSVSFWYRVPTAFTAQWAPGLYWTTSVDTKITNAISGSPNLAGGLPNALPNTTAWTYVQFQGFVPLTAQALSIVFNTYNNVVNGATIQITGVQLEKGTIATPFEVRPYATELQLCQRYYWRMSWNAGNTRFGIVVVRSTTACHLTQILPVTLRAAPSSIGGSGTFGLYPSGAAIASITGVTGDSAIFSASWDFAATGLTAGQAQELYASAASYLDVSAEL
jgi:hypothetical protein